MANDKRQMPKPRRGGLTPVSKRGLVEEVVTKLEAELRNGAFEVGTKLPPEPQLQAQLGVGRTTIREAVRVLAHAGMLDVRQGDGTYVRAKTMANRELAGRLERAHALEVLAVRRALDIEMVRIAALARSESDLVELTEIVERMRGILKSPDRDADAFADAGTELHLAVAASTHNEVLIDVYSSFATVLRRACGELARMPGAMEACFSRHERLLEAITDRNPKRAQAVTAKYLDLVNERLAAVTSRRITTRVAS